MQFFESTDTKITKSKNSENVPYLEIARALLAHFINKIRGPCIHLFHKNGWDNYQIFHTITIFLKTLHSEFSFIEVQFKDRNSKPLEVEDKINITLVMK